MYIAALLTDANAFVPQMNEEHMTYFHKVSLTSSSHYIYRMP